MAVQPRPADATVNTGNSAAPSLPRPSGVLEGDTLYIAIQINGNTVLTSDGGVCVSIMTLNRGSMSTAIFRRRVGPLDTEPATYAFTSSVSLAWSVVLVPLWGVHVTTPQDANTVGRSETVASLTHVVDAITTVTAGAMLLAIAASDSSSGDYTGFPAGYTLFKTTAAGTLRDLAIYYKEIAAPGAQPATSYTHATNTVYDTYHLAIRPAPAPVTSGNLFMPGVA